MKNKKLKTLISDFSLFKNQKVQTDINPNDFPLDNDVQTKKRKLSGKFVSLVCVLLLIAISAFKIPSFITHKNLKALGYSKEAITSILDRKMKNTILDNEYYSDFLNEEIVKESFNVKYLNLYLNRSSLTQEDIDLYEKLAIKKEYTTEELDNLFIKLTYPEIQPLLLFDKQEKLDDYINDMATNGINNFKGNYLKPYENVITISDPSSTEVVANFKRSLGAYEPGDLVKLGTTYSIPNVELESRAYEAFYKQLAPAMSKLNFGIYATGGYVSYEDQKALYEMYDLPEDADERGVIKPGHNEKQAGLTVTVVAAENGGSTGKFMETNAYRYLKAHAHEYGFIFRYPTGKEKFTGRSDDFQNQLRYVGVNLATKLYESGLSLDEYYAYYLD